jgi:ABC-type Zn uptake system ZnuABC Zn-binding protein ZnuA
MRYVELARDALARLDPQHAAGYHANSAALSARLARLDAAIFECVASIPADRRRLVTYHDAFAYFAPRYGLELIGALQPTDFSEPGARDVARLIVELRELEVPAVFGSALFPTGVLEQVAIESGVRYVDSLRDDVLPGRPGSPDHSYEGMMRANVRVITEALGGDPGCLVDSG